MCRPYRRSPVLSALVAGAGAFWGRTTQASSNFPPRVEFLSHAVPPDSLTGERVLLSAQCLQWTAPAHALGVQVVSLGVGDGFSFS